MILLFVFKVLLEQLLDRVGEIVGTQLYYMRIFRLQIKRVTYSGL